MKGDKENSAYFGQEPEDSEDSEDIEILEVVGVDDDPTGRPRGGPIPAIEQDDPAETDDDAVVLSLDEDRDRRGLELAGSLPDPAAVAHTDTDLPAPTDDEGLDTTEQVRRLRSDYDNLRNRVSRERREYEIRANSVLVARLLPVLDNFERAVQHASDNGHGDDSFHEGVVMIYRQLMGELHREGLRPIEPVGRPFDPSIHDAVAMDDTSPFPPNTVVEELQRGYLFLDRVLRPARVKVSIGTATDVTPDAEDEVR